MEGLPIDIVIFAPLAPIFGLMLFWFIQLLFIESQKYLLSKIRDKHKPLCRFTNFLGIFFQTICHALGYTVTKSGISEVYISVSYGKVSPKKQRKGVFEWVSNAFLFIGPFFIPAFLLLIPLFLLVNNGFTIVTPTNLVSLKYTFGGQLIIFGASLHTFSSHFFGFIATIDLLHPAHLGFLILMIFLGMGIRPSHLGESKKEKVDMIYDLRNIWDLIRKKPLYLIIFFAAAYVLFYISVLLNENFYVILFTLFGMLSIIAIASIIISQGLIILINATDKITGYKKFLPFLFLPFSYILCRLFFYYYPIEQTRSLSLLVMLISTVAITYYLLISKNDNFKTKKNMKLLTKKMSGDADE